MEPSLDEINKELASIRPCYNYGDLSFENSRRDAGTSTKEIDPSERNRFLTDTFCTGLVSKQHPECSTLKNEEQRVAKFQALVLEDPEKVLCYFASNLAHTSFAALAVAPALTSIAHQALQDDAAWMSFNDKLRVFMNIVGAQASDSLSNSEYRRLTKLGFERPKTAKVIAEGLREYFSLIESGR
jgi:hypothetical protein